MFMLFSACSDDYNDATSKHVYGENENPYLRIDTECQANVAVNLEVNGDHSLKINLSDYADLFANKIGMSLDEVIAGLDNGTTVFYPINTTNNQWLKTEYNKDNAGWYFNSANQPCDADDENCKAYVTLDKAAKTLNVGLSEGGISAGTVLSVNVGFAKNGPDYDDYVYFTLAISVTDPTVAVISVNFADGIAVPVNLADYQENIEAAFDMPYADFISSIADNDGIKFSLFDVTTGAVKDMGENYTANAPGYWMNTSGDYINWGVDGFTAYVEYYSSDEACSIGYNADLPSGTNGQFTVGWVDTNDTSKFFRLIVTWTIQ